MHAFLLALGVVFLAELGDKSQLLALTLAARRPALQVLVGVSLAALALQGLSAGVGAGLASAVPMRSVTLLAALGFLVAALLTLRRPDDARALTPTRAGSTVLLSFAVLLVAELGDKTMLATAALATREPPLWSWLGGTAGFVLADALAIGLGMTLFRRLPVRAVRLGTAALLAAFGGVLLLGLLQPSGEVAQVTSRRLAGGPSYGTMERSLRVPQRTEDVDVEESSWRAQGPRTARCGWRSSAPDRPASTPPTC